MSCMEELAKEFVGRGSMKGFMFRQLRANGLAYLYEVRSGVNVWYEVFRRRTAVAKDVVMGGTLVHFGERVLYPSDNAFGIWAWSCGTLSRAERFFARICVTDDDDVLAGGV